MNDAIKTHAFLANHSSGVRIKRGNARLDSKKSLNKLCIVFLCLEQSILPYMYSVWGCPQPKHLEGSDVTFKKSL